LNPKVRANSEDRIECGTPISRFYQGCEAAHQENINIRRFEQTSIVAAKIDR